jgi:hypothetical protein
MMIDRVEADVAEPGPQPGDADDDIIVVHMIGDPSKGPVLLACGPEPVCRPIFRDIIRLPSLPWLTGALMLGYVGDVGKGERSRFDCEPFRNPDFDETLYLDFLGRGAEARKAYRRQAYWSLLRKMTEIGMISGRGVPRS